MPERTFEERVVKAARLVWELVGGDCLLNKDEERDSYVTMTREEVMEVSTDANRMSQMASLSREDEKKYYSLSKLKQEAIMKMAFQYERYGW